MAGVQRNRVAYRGGIVIVLFRFVSTQMYRLKIEHTEKEGADALERRRLAYEAEIATVRKEKEELRVKYVELSQTPEAAKILAARNDHLRLKVLETRIAELEDERRKLRNEIEQLIGQAKSVGEQRLAVERELMIANARLEAAHTSHDELDRLRKTNSALHDELARAKCETLEQQTLAKEVARQKERIKEDYTRLKQSLDTERRELTEFKVAADKNVAKLRTCLEEERAEAR